MLAGLGLSSKHGSSVYSNKEENNPVETSEAKEERVNRINGEEKNLPEGIETTVEAEVEKCKQLIEKEEYDAIIGNPCLASTLYYSDAAIKKMAPPYEYATEEIISRIHLLISKKFRENYIALLKTKMAQTQTEKMGLMSGAAHPLDNLSFGNNLNENHLDAVDLFTKEGAPVYSVSGGLVVLAESGWIKDEELSTSSMRGGNSIIIFNPVNETFQRYAHLGKITVGSGTIVHAGQKIGTVGNTGINASRPGRGGHLHFEINRYDRIKGIMVAEDVFSLKRKLETGQY